ncbi:N-acetyl-D-Glu racemase DgcA [Labrys monachus]|uniref:Dipeptide epimerase n=1 Tax=Labrys monachus TaxID=217067 RepID=A0ABU0FM41_9HYPH|nr:N-acetyl-D-Glu racemase DgcA [Labrys monachus]MDQ0395163.1 L-alanine-DL-glutamate epimerase-like enolase superfamily enzyme [Labrys monachus]
MSRRLSIAVERWPLAAVFTIARGSRTEAVVVVVEISCGDHVGRGECVPYARYGETVEGIAEAIEAQRAAIEAEASRDALQRSMPPGAARNAVDCALWDLEAKIAGRPVWQLAGLPQPRPVTTAYTLSLGDADAMGEAAAAAAHRPLLKVKLGRPDDAARIAAVRRNAPHSSLIVDANEGWRADDLARNFAACAQAGVVLIEQPLPASEDAALAEIERIVPVCADESLHDRASLPGLAGRYDAINIKLDKAGGLTEAIALARDASALGFDLMIGCMVGTSLAMAPALLLAGQARVVDLDGPLLLAKDRQAGLLYEGSTVHPPDPALWG